MFTLIGVAFYGSLIASFASHTPPPATRRPYKLYNNNGAEVWIAPTKLSTWSTLAYSTQDSDEDIHYFQYTFDNELMHCIWAHPMSMAGKTAVFSEVKEWYYRATNNTLTSNMTVTDDAIAWYLV